MYKSCIDDAFVQSVVERYANMLFRVSYQYVRNAPDAEDVVQDVLLQLMDRAFCVGFESDEHMKAWLIRVAINKSKNLAKGNARRRKRETTYGASQQRNGGETEDLETAMDKSLWLRGKRSISIITKDIPRRRSRGCSAKRIGRSRNACPAHAKS